MSYIIFHLLTSGMYTDTFSMFTSALLGLEVLAANFYLYSFIIILRQTISKSLELTIAKIIWNGLCKNNASLNRLYYRTHILLAFIIILLLGPFILKFALMKVLINFFSGLISDLVVTEIDQTLLLLFCLNLLTHTLKSTQVGTLKALHLFHPNDTLLLKLHITAYILIPLLSFSILTCFFNWRLKGLWTGQILCDIYLIVLYNNMYL